VSILLLFQNSGGGGPVTHDTSGVLTGPGSAIVGAATNFTVHSTSGALTGQIGSVVGSAARAGGAVTHATTGTLTGQGSSIVGAASNFTPHATSGTLTGQGSTVAGAAARTRVHPSSGVLAGPGSSVVGAASNFTPHSTSGALVGSGSVIDGAASRSSGAVSHDTSGVLVGDGSAISGQAEIGSEPPITGGHYGAWWAKKYREMWECGTKKPNLTEVIASVKESPVAAIESVPELLEKVEEKFPDIDYSQAYNNARLMDYVAQQLMLHLESIQHERELEDEDESILLLM